MDNQFQRLELLIGDKLEVLQKSKVMIVGIGGVGSFAAEAIARLGIKKIVLVDKDVVDISNLNRQLIALHSTIGQAKVEVMAKRILDINPQAIVTPLHLCIDEVNIIEVLDESFDFVIDACDTLDAKVAIIQHCLTNKIKFISSMGAANRFDPTKVEISYLDKTYNDPLAKVMRSKIKKRHLKGKIPVVFSTELPFKPLISNLDESSSILGSNSFVPSTFGLACASFCFKKLLSL